MRLLSRLGELRSMSGRALSWRQPVRVAYIDEAGVSNPHHEPLMVVSGVILDGDQDMQPIVRHLKSLVRKHIPEEDRLGFIFHSTNIFSGTKYFENREVWPRKRRNAILHDIALIPQIFHLPIVVGAIDRRLFASVLKSRQGINDQERIDQLAHAEAYIQVAVEVDRWIRRNARNEVGLIIAEDRPGMKNILNLIHSGAQSGEDAYWTEQSEDVFTLDNVVDAIHLLRKQDSPLLQVADICAFIIKRCITGKKDVNDLFGLLEPQLVSPPSRDGAWKLPSEPLPRLFRVTVPRQSVEPSQ